MYKEDLYMWSRITSVPKKNQAEAVVYNLQGHSSGIKEKIVINIEEKLKENDGIKEFVTLCGLENKTIDYSEFCRLWYGCVKLNM